MGRNASQPFQRCHPTSSPHRTDFPRDVVYRWARVSRNRCRWALNTPARLPSASILLRRRAPPHARQVLSGVRSGQPQLVHRWTCSWIPRTTTVSRVTVRTYQRDTGGRKPLCTVEFILPNARRDERMVARQFRCDLQMAVLGKAALCGLVGPFRLLTRSFVFDQLSKGRLCGHGAVVFARLAALF